MNDSLAVIFQGPERPLDLQRFPLPTLTNGEVLVEVLCCTLCGSDLHTFAGHRSVSSPLVLGHEILGRVCALPEDGEVLDWSGDRLEIGKRVTWSIVVGCGACFFCCRAMPQKCDRLRKYGHQQISPRHSLSGGLSEYCHLVPGTAIFTVADDLSDAMVCPANCATATVAAALRVAGDVHDAVVLIQGVGMLGLTAAAMTRSRGAREVITVDINTTRLAQAERFGATRMFKVDEEDSLRRFVQRTTNGRGVDVVLELSGAAASFPLGIDLLRIGGCYVLIGAVFPTDPTPLSMESIVRKLLRIEGVHNYVPDDLNTALKFLAQEKDVYPFSELVSESFPLERTEDAFSYATAERPFRVAVIPSH